MPSASLARTDLNPTAVGRRPGRTVVDAGGEFDRQLDRLVRLGYGDVTGLGERGLREAVEPLRAVAVSRTSALPAPQTDAVPFVVVLAPRLTPPASTMPLITRGTRTPRPGFVSPDTQDVDRFAPIDGVQLPDGDAYLLVDVQRGDDLRSWRPDDALPEIVRRGRTPLTVHEGIALVTLVPDALEKNRCFMLLASRSGDRRVPALWISGGSERDGGRERRGAAKLGWCWAGNLHTWLGHASAAGRVD